MYSVVVLRSGPDRVGAGTEASLEHLAFQRLADVRPVLHKARHVMQVSGADRNRRKPGFPSRLDEVVQGDEPRAFRPAHQMGVLVGKRQRRVMLIDDDVARGMQPCSRIP